MSLIALSALLALSTAAAPPAPAASPRATAPATAAEPTTAADDGRRRARLAGAGGDAGPGERRARPGGASGAGGAPFGAFAGHRQPAAGAPGGRGGAGRRRRRGRGARAWSPTSPASTSARSPPSTTSRWRCSPPSPSTSSSSRGRAGSGSGSGCRAPRRYIPMMTPVLEQAGLPRDTVYLAMIESGFSPGATSWARAAGPWQFISATGRRFGLKQDFWLDERRDPLKATAAAARYLGELHDPARALVPGLGRLQRRRREVAADGAQAGHRRLLGSSPTARGWPRRPSTTSPSSSPARWWPSIPGPSASARTSSTTRSRWPGTRPRWWSPPTSRCLPAPPGPAPRRSAS